MPSPIRIGLLVDSLTQPRWVSRIVDDITDSSIATLVLVVRNVEARERSSILRRAWRLRHHLFYGIYRRIDEWMLRHRSDAFEVVSITPSLRDVRQIHVRPIRSGASLRFSDTDVQAVADHDVDVLLLFGFGILRGRILEVPRFGVWSYHHGDNARFRGQPAGVWEVIEGSPVTGTMLQALNEDLDNGRVLYRSYSTTSRFSAQANRNRTFWKSSTFVMRKLHELYELGEDSIDDAATVPVISPYSRRMYRTPENTEMLRGVIRIGGRVMSSVVRSALWREQWFVAYGFGASSAPNVRHSFHRFKRLVPPPDRFWADPFPMTVGDKHYIFLEEYLYASRKAHISVVEVRRNGVASMPVPVLQRPYHLSYPFTFEWRGDRFMVPEAAGSGQVELYRARSFPDGWVMEQALLEDVPGIDPTIAEIDGKWWMFLNLAPDRAGYGDNDELHLYAADTPLGPWRPHPRNPVKSDVRSARPAGRLFRYGNDWYRPSQDSSHRYGFAVKINRVTELTESWYREEEVATMLPEWYRGLLASHTFNQADGLCCIDGLVRRRKFG